MFLPAQASRLELHRHAVQAAVAPAPSHMGLGFRSARCGRDRRLMYSTSTLTSYFVGLWLRSNDSLSQASARSRRSEARSELPAGARTPPAAQGERWDSLHSTNGTCSRSRPQSPQRPTANPVARFHMGSPLPPGPAPGPPLAIGQAVGGRREARDGDAAALVEASLVLIAVDRPPCVADHRPQLAADVRQLFPVAERDLNIALHRVEDGQRRGRGTRVAAQEPRREPHAVDGDSRAWVRLPPRCSTHR